MNAPQSNPTASVAAQRQRHLDDRAVGLSRRACGALVGAVLAASLAAAPATAQDDPLPSWNDGAAKTAIIDFVTRTTTEGGADYVPPAERIAAFDQDGTLWVEQPIYTEVEFALDRVPDLVKARPDLADKEPFKTILTGDRDAIGKLPIKELFEALLATQSGMTPSAFAADVNAWLETARHERWDRPFTDLTYLPMQEVLQYLRANDYATFIATGGNVGFVQPYAERVYGIPPQQVSGSAQTLKFSVEADGTPILTREEALSLNNLGAGKIENFLMVYGRRPLFQAGNSSGDDQQALQYVQEGPGLTLSMAILHDDAQREYAYGPADGLPDSSVGTFSQEMYDLGRKEGWIIVSMKNDWKRLFAFEE